MADNQKIKQIQIGSTTYDIAGQTLDSNNDNSGIAYLEVVEFDSTTGTLNLTTKYLHLI